MQPLLLHFAPAVFAAVKRGSKPSHTRAQEREMQDLLQRAGAASACFNVAALVGDARIATGQLVALVGLTCSV
jgi:hypothetical protein